MWIAFLTVYSYRVYSVHLPCFLPGTVFRVYTVPGTVFRVYTAWYCVCSVYCAWYWVYSVYCLVLCLQCILPGTAFRVYTAWYHVYSVCCAWYRVYSVFCLVPCLQCILPGNKKRCKCLLNICKPAAQGSLANKGGQANFVSNFLTVNYET